MAKMEKTSGRWGTVKVDCFYEFEGDLYDTLESAEKVWRNIGKRGRIKEYEYIDGYDWQSIPYDSKETFDCLNDWIRDFSKDYPQPRNVTPQK